MWKKNQRQRFACFDETEDTGDRSDCSVGIGRWSSSCETGEFREGSSAKCKCGADAERGWKQEGTGENG